MVPLKAERCGVVQGSAVRLLAESFALAAAALLVSCAQERGIQPRPPHYNLYATVEVSGGIAIDVIDTESDSVLHRIPDAGGGSAIRLKASPNGEYLATYGGTRASLVDIATGSITASTSTILIDACFLPAQSQLIGLSTQSAIVYALPGLEIDTILSLNLERCCWRVPQNDLVAIIRSSDFYPDPLFDGLIRFNPSNWNILDSFTFKSPFQDGPVFVAEAGLSTDGNAVYLLGSDRGGPAVYAFDLNTHALRFRQPVQTPLGKLEVSPDGQEIWLTQSFITFYHPYPPDLGYVLVLESRSGQPLDTIRTIDLNVPHTELPLAVREIAFHPAQPKVYVSAYMGIPGVLVIDTETKSITATIYGDRYGGVFDLAISAR